jgi:5'-nucleotidase / UDP-sugar diphosphatase
MRRIFTILTVILFSFGVIACDDDDDPNNNTLTEICDNLTDDDGDGDIDCDDTDCTDDAACQTTDEICDNDTDDDGDGDVDCDDTDCTDDPACEDIIKHITIIGTSDIHSHLMGVGPASDYTPLDTSDNDITTSGLARIAAVIGGIQDAKDASGVPTVLIDSGDFLMGDMVDLLSGEAPPVFHFFQHMGYDSVTLGNHDFDWTPAGAAVIINAARSAFFKFDIPIVSSNIQFDANDASDDAVAALVDDGTIVRYVIRVIDDDFSVGIMGKLGIEADSNVPQAAPITWWHDDPTSDATGFDQTQALVDEMREVGGAQMVIHASHQGINANGVGEDRDVAAGVDGIDVIFSGHRHQILEHPDHKITVGNTLILSTGKKGEYVSQLDVTFNVTEAVIVDATAYLHTIDDTVEGDPTMAAMMDTYITNLDEAVLLPLFGMSYSATPIATMDFDLTHIDFYSLPTGQIIETPSGLLVADAMRTVMNTVIGQAVAGGILTAIPTYDASPILFAVAETGAVRDPVYRSSTDAVSAADAFRLFPLGIGPDMLPGYPMLSFYITKAELKILLNMNVESLKGNVPFEYYLQPSGLRYIWDDAGDQFDKVRGVYICAVEDAFTSKDCLLSGDYIMDLTNDSTATDDMIRVAVDYYVALLLPQARNALGSNLVMDPKYKDGTLIDMNDPVEVASLRFDANPGGDFTELKVWVALLKFIEGFSDDWKEIDLAPGVTLNYMEPTDGIPSIPARIYSNDPAPAGHEAIWRLGLDRNMTLVQFCAIAGSAHPICP